MISKFSVNLISTTKYVARIVARAYYATQYTSRVVYISSSRWQKH